LKGGVSVIRDKEGLLPVLTGSKLGSYLSRSNLDVLVTRREISLNPSDSSFDRVGYSEETGMAVSPTTRDNRGSSISDVSHSDTSSILLTLTPLRDIWSNERTLKLKAQLSEIGLPLKKIQAYSAFVASHNGRRLGKIIVFDYFAGLITSNGKQSTCEEELILFLNGFSRSEVKLVLRAYRSQFGRFCINLAWYRRDGQLAYAKLNMKGGA
jgi:hypothetical protein